MERPVLQERREMVVMAGNNIVAVGVDNWKSEVADSPIPVIVDFWAEWCGPCRALSPILDELSVELAGKLKVAKVNIDESAQLAAKFGVRSIPTLILLKNGAVQEQMVGLMSKAALKGKISAHV